MKKFLKSLTLAISVALAAIGAQAQEQIPAFPGAEGFGRYVTGGRGGEIYHVTNLNDSGTGSLRDAVSKSGRIVVFDVSGVIHLQSALVFKGNSTILGQTAPGEGIQVYGDRVSFSGASNLIVRYMRFRMGSSGTSGADACGVANGENMIFDHLSVLWGRDENFSVSWDNKGTRPRNITIQNSIIGQGLQSHSCGGLIQTIGGVTLFRNLYIENKTRNVKAKGLNQFVNNVVYNWGDGAAYIMSDSEGDSWADIENNYFMRGPWEGATEPFTRGIASFKFYGNGNFYDKDKDGVLNGYLMPMEEQIGSKGGTYPYSTPFESLDALNANIDDYNAANSLSESHADFIKHLPAISSMMSAEEAYAWMIESVGPVLPARDEVDQYLIDELMSYGKTGTTGGISKESQLPHKGTGTLSGGAKPADSDGDGIPDAWETANGLNPADPSDAAAIADNGYSNIENYANSLTGPVAPYIKKPIGLAAKEVAKNSIVLSWELNYNTDNGFEIEITDPAGTTTTLTTPAGQTELTVDGLTARTSYNIRMRAVSPDGSIVSDYSDTITVATIDDPTAPAFCINPFPANGSKEAVGAGLTFKWESPTTYGGEVIYTLLLGETADALTALATDLHQTAYSADCLEPNKTYYWRVDARNDIGETRGDVWSFTSTAGGVLFYTDFHTAPDAWVEKYGHITDNTNIVNAANTSVSVGGMVIGSGENSIRILNMPGTYSADLNKDYGPATADDAGATPYSIQFYTTKAGGYLRLPEVDGPCVLTIWLGNPDKSQKTVKMKSVCSDGVTAEQSLVLGSAKRIYKHTVTYDGTAKVTFTLDANAKKIDVNDVLIEKLISSEGSDAIIDIYSNTPTDSPAYNVMGIKVDDSYRGIIIKNGKKYINR